MNKGGEKGRGNEDVKNFKKKRKGRTKSIIGG